jgi:predicted TIM-barrel fold metal-dependent hydrolase
MERFVFSADGHVREPRELFTDAVPKHKAHLGINVRKDETSVTTFVGDRMVHRHMIVPPKKEWFDMGRPFHKGLFDLDARMEDMQMEGIDAEILFPTTGMLTFVLEDPEVEMRSVEAYNNWHQAFVGNRTSTFVRCGVLPVRDFDNTVEEMKRLTAMGFTCAMLPSLIPPGVPNYNDPSWDQVFQAAQDLNMVMVIHTATGRPDVRVEKGPGGALVNYTGQILDSISSLMYLIAGGVLDRFPGVHVAFIECGASWLAGVGERMDETYHGHSFFVSPKLSVQPTDIIKRQIHASFQYDRACIMSRSVTGVAALMWGSDYPHHEGTFPNSREVVEHLFDGIEISEEEKAAILGGNAATLFRLPRH